MPRTPLFRLGLLALFCLLAIGAAVLLRGGQSQPPPAPPAPKADIFNPDRLVQHLQPQPEGALERAREAGVYPAPPERTDLHTHVALRLSVDGATYVADPSLGTVLNRPILLAIHAHDKTGIVHFHRKPGKPAFTLHQIWAVWGLRVPEGQIGPLRVGRDARARLFLDGKPVPFAQNRVLKDRSDLVLVVERRRARLPLRSPLKPFDWKLLKGSLQPGESPLQRVP